LEGYTVFEEKRSMTESHDRQSPARRTGPAAAADGPMIEFFCPNGHHIRVPAAWAGKRGPCTKCGAMVTIPGAAANPLLEAEPVADTDPLDDLLAPMGAGAVDQADFPDEPSAGAADAADAPWHPTADLVARLWAERDHGGTLEVHHADGVIVPDWYDVTWSRGTHGVFGSQAVDGTVTITAVAWSAVQKVIVRQVKTLPDDMFPGG
jgi:hypothetical protein